MFDLDSGIGSDHEAHNVDTHTDDTMTLKPFIFNATNSGDEVLLQSLLLRYDKKDINSTCRDGLTP